MDLTKRYVYAVTTCLPENQREEVAKELSASIDDMARDKSGGKKPSEAHIREVLEELGNPLVVARQYWDTGEYLIGPTMYYPYIQLLKRILLVALPIYSLVFALTYDSYDAPIRVGELIVSYGAGLFTTALHVLFWITAIFFVIQKTGIKVDQFTNNENAWSVDSLPASPHDTQISRIDTFSSMAFYAGLVVGGIALWRLLGNGSLGSFFNIQLTQFWLPALIALGVFGAIVEAIKLAVSNWNKWLIAVTLLLNTVCIVFMVALAGSQTIFNPDLGTQTREIATWSAGITVVVFIISYVHESYKVIRTARSIGRHPEK